MNRRRLLQFACIGVTSLGMVVCVPATLQAQDAAQQPQTAPDAQGAPQAPQHMRSHSRHSPEAQLKHLTKELTLTPDEQQQIMPILQQQDQQVQKLRADTSVTPQDRRTQMHSIMDDTHQKIEGTLTDTQKQKFEQMQQKHQGKHHGNMQQNGNPNGPPPPAEPNGENPPPPPPQR